MIDHRHRLGDRVTAYIPEKVMQKENDSRFEVYNGTVSFVYGNSLSYDVVYEDIEDYRKNVRETYVFKEPELLFKMGERVMACYPKNAQNKNCAERYKKFPATVISVNSDATYRIQYDVNPYFLYLLKPQKSADRSFAPQSDRCIENWVREMWITPPAPFMMEKFQKMEKLCHEPIGKF